MNVICRNGTSLLGIADSEMWQNCANDLFEIASLYEIQLSLKSGLPNTPIFSSLASKK
jgi:hypothetical protein